MKNNLRKNLSEPDGQERSLGETMRLTYKAQQQKIQTEGTLVQKPWSQDAHGASWAKKEDCQGSTKTREKQTERGVANSG